MFYVLGAGQAPVRVGRRLAKAHDLVDRGVIRCSHRPGEVAARSTSRSRSRVLVCGLCSPPQRPTNVLSPPCWVPSCPGARPGFIAAGSEYRRLGVESGARASRCCAARSQPRSSSKHTGRVLSLYRPALHRPRRIAALARCPGPIPSKLGSPRGQIRAESELHK